MDYMTTILRKLLFGAFTLLLPLLSSAQGNLKMYFSYGVYADPKSGPYLEVYTKALASTLCHKRNKDSTYGAGVSIEYAIMAGDSVKAHENFTVLSPNLKDTNNAHFFLMDMHRSWMQPGDYILKFVCRDINNPDIYSSASLAVKVRYNGNQTSFGHLLLLDTFYNSNKESSFMRDDVTYIPYVSSLHTMERKSIRFYTELYNIEKFSGKMENITLQYYIKDLKGRIIPGCEGYIKKNAKSKIAFAATINISKLPTGEYALWVLARNEHQDVLATNSTLFMRINDPLVPGYDLGRNMFINIINLKEVNDFAKYVDIISDKAEIDEFNSTLKLKDSMAVKNWFYEFWHRRDRNSAGRAYADFENRLDSVNKLFAYGKIKGYESDRGYMYLRYGPAERISASTVTDSTYPYEVWTYNNIGGVGMARMIFYRNSKTDNQYIILHSDIRGFAHNPNWMDQIKMKRKNGWVEEKKSSRKK